MEDDELQLYRKDIDEIDSDIIELLIERFELAERIAQYKRLNNIPVSDRERERAHLNDIAQKSKPYQDCISEVFSLIISISKRIQHRTMNLYLIGMSGCGKTKCGKILSKVLNMPFADTDKLVMQESGMSIDEIFDKYGECEFRKAENKALALLAARGGYIVATGGGIITNPDNISILHGSGYIVFLNRDPEKLLQQRVHNRPLIRNGADSILKLYKDRLSTYISNADYIINPDNRGAISRIADRYRRYCEKKTE